MAGLGRGGGEKKTKTSDTAAGQAVAEGFGRRITFIFSSFIPSSSSSSSSSTTTTTTTC